MLEKLRWGMTVSEVRGLYPQIDILATAPGGTWFVDAKGHVEFPATWHHYTMHWLKRYPWRGCLANASLLFGPDGQLTQIWLDDHPDTPRPCKVMALAQIEQHFGEGIDQNRLAPTARIADCRPLAPQDRTWPAHMGGIWRCWKKDGTLVRVFDGDPQPLVLSKAGAEETPFARPLVDPLWGY